MSGGGEESEKSPLEKEGESQTTCDELTAALIPHAPVPLGGRR